jgi:hypothetical protein
VLCDSQAVVYGFLRLDEVFYGAQCLVQPFEKNLYVIKRSIMKDLTVEINSLLPLF